MAKAYPCVHVVIPVFNRLQYTKECLLSLTKQTYKNIQIILVDDGSTDGTDKYVTKFFPKVKIVTGDGNWWWTKCMYEGVNLALKDAKKGDFVLEMNNDCSFDKNYISQLLTFYEKHPNSLIGSLCVSSKKTTHVVEAGVRINWKQGLVYGVAPAVSSDLKYFQKMEYIDKLDALPGKGTLIPVEVFTKVGNFNYIKFPHYVADYEFVCRAKRNGFGVYVDPKAIVVHHFEATGVTYRDVNSAFNYKKAWSILFGRRSMSNIVDWLNFLFACCPRDLLALNLYTTFWRTLYGMTRMFPFIIFRPIVPLVPRLIWEVYHMPELPEKIKRKLSSRY